MSTATLQIDLDALVANWRALDAKSADQVETAAVVKADGYGLDAARVGSPLPLKLLRNGREISLSVKPAPLPGLA